jgi:vitamin-K-epoxide reductase (warfarin-sensitive)
MTSVARSPNIGGTDRQGSSPRRSWIFWAIALLALAGMVVSSVSLHHHYGTSPTSYCDFGANFNCDIVNRSIYSTVFGIPDALIGILGYAVLLALATLYRTKAETPIMLLIASVAGLGFALYLTYIEAFVLATWCILCLSSLTLIFAITVLSAVLAATSRRRA